MRTITPNGPRAQEPTMSGIIELGHGYFARTSNQGLALCRPPAEGESRQDIDPWIMAADLADARRLVLKDHGQDAAVAFASLGGSQKSKAKTTAAKANGKKGGRPSIVQRAVDSARITDRALDRVRVEFDFVGCYGDLCLQTRKRIESGISKKFSLKEYNFVNGLTTETGEEWEYAEKNHG